MNNGLGLWAAAVPALVFAILALSEQVRPRRKLALGRHPRWITHAVFFITNAAVGRAMAYIVVVGGPIVGAETWAAANGFGLFNLTSWPWWVEAALAVILLDFAVWFQHLMLHRIGFLWRMHKVHHSDRDLDASSALRFHPLELIVSTLYKSVLVGLLGVPVLTALLFELWLNANALFNHSNLSLPKWTDRMIRPILVTPDMHFVHHSIVVGEQNKNYGFAISAWDRLFGTYLAEAASGQDRQIVGLAEAQDGAPGRAGWSMLLPFRQLPQRSPIGQER